MNYVKCRWKQALFGVFLLAAYHVYFCTGKRTAACNLILNTESVFIDPAKTRRRPTCRRLIALVRADRLFTALCMCLTEKCVTSPHNPTTIKPNSKWQTANTLKRTASGSSTRQPSPVSNRSTKASFIRKLQKVSREAQPPTATAW